MISPLSAILLVLTFGNQVVFGALVLDGSPGVGWSYDSFNHGNWNRTYGLTEPQQVHISISSHAEYAKVQFATVGVIDQAILRYWPKGDAKMAIQITDGENWAFVDNGTAKHTIYLHNLQTKRLKPATIFEYQVGGSNKQGNITWNKLIFEFHTARKGNTVSFIATADIGLVNAVIMPSLKRLAASHKYDFLTLSGDQAYDLSDFNGTKGDEYTRFAESVFANIPFVGGVGNHEATYNFSHWKNRFSNVPFQDSGFHNNMQYSFNYKSLHIVSWNSESDFEGSEGELETSLNWLERDLQKANQNRKAQPWIVVLGHRPLYCSSFATPDDTSCTKDTEKLRDGHKDKATGKRSNGVEAVLDNYKVDMYLCGHRHNFERTYPVKKGQVTSSSYRNAPSLFQYLVGNGGNYDLITSFNATGPFPAWSAARYSGYGYSTVQVTHHQIELTHWGVSNNGIGHRVIDHVVVTKA